MCCHMEFSLRLETMGDRDPRYQSQQSPALEPSTDPKQISIQRTRPINRTHKSSQRAKTACFFWKKISSNVTIGPHVLLYLILNSFAHSFVVGLRNPLRPRFPESPPLQQWHRPVAQVHCPRTGPGQGQTIFAGP